MWKPMMRWLISTLTLFTLCLAVNLTVTAQTPNDTVLVATPTEIGIQIYSLDTTGQQTLVRNFAAFRIGDPINPNFWFIHRHTDLTVSLDGAHIAFTAQRNGEWALFVYTLATNALHQVALPAALVPTWSPDSSAILLKLGSFEPPFHDYVYDLVARHLIQITNTPEFAERDFRWLPDSSGLVYVGLYQACEICEVDGQALYYVSRNGTETRLLANATAVVQSDSEDTVCHPTWSEPNQRIYYIIGCVGGGDSANEYLYSVDLAGNYRPEISAGLASFYPEEFNTRTVNIHPSQFTSDIYLTVSSQGGDGTSQGNWRIVHLLSPDEIVIVYEQTLQDGYLNASSMSPDGMSIALTTSSVQAVADFLEVIDLTSEELVISRNSTPLEVCNAFWVDDNRLFYTVDPTGACEPYFALQGVWVLDIANNTTYEVTTELGNNVWMLR